jgi:hypothetical protein
MQELEVLLQRHDKTIKFDPRKNRIRCYPHIINICSSHVIASSTCISKKFLETLKSECGGEFVYLNVEGDDNDDGDGDDSDDSDDDGDGDGDNDNDGGRSFARDIPDLTLDDAQLGKILDRQMRAWYSGLKRDPIKRARRVVRILRSSDKRKQGFTQVIDQGNESGWFKSADGEVVVIPHLELLRDVRTRWDSVFYMIERLLALRPVSVHPFRLVHIVKT